MKKIRFWRDPARRRQAIQFAVAVLFLALVGFFVVNAAQNLSQRGIASGFGFLSNRAGFTIIQHLIDYDESSSYFRVLIVALLNTILAAGLGIILASVIGLVVGVARLSQNWLIAKLALIYVETIRNLPMLLLLLIVYLLGLRPLPGPRQSLNIADMIFLNNRGLFLPKPFLGTGAWIIGIVVILCLSGLVILTRRAMRYRIETGHLPGIFLWQCLGVLMAPILVFSLTDDGIHFDVPALHGFNFTGGFVVIPELVALVLALGLYGGSLIAEIVRSGIQSVAQGQLEAASALGLHHGLQLRLVIIPQAVRIIIPPLTSEYLNIIKNSSLAAAIAYPDLVQAFAGTVLNQTGQAVEVICITMAIYLLLAIGLSGAMTWIDRHSQAGPAR
jgi:general L-amino acid transport system permease protein